METVRDIAHRTLAVMERELEHRLDYALFLRALRAEMDPEARGSAPFDKPGELERYLTGAASSS